MLIKESIETNFNANRMDFSILKEFYSKKPYRDFSIKYVLSGTEHYLVNGRKHEIKNNEYLLANKFSEGYAEVNSKEYVKGICINLSQDILSEVVAAHLKPNVFEIDYQLDTFFRTDSFLENKYDTKTTLLGNFLTQQALSIVCTSNKLVNQNKEFYYTLAEKIVADHIPIFKQLQNVKALKNSTKKELFLKLLKAQEYINSCFLSPIKINEVATYCGLSEYHFFRLHKSTFAISPLQYVLKKRLKHAQQLLKTKNASITETAYACGFSDVFTFSKSFKKHFGYPPKDIITKKAGFDKIKK